MEAEKSHSRLSTIQTLWKTGSMAQYKSEGLRTRRAGCVPQSQAKGWSRAESAVSPGVQKLKNLELWSKARRKRACSSRRVRKLPFPCSFGLSPPD